MRCANCNYVFQPLEEQCARCGWKEGDPVKKQPALEETASASDKPKKRKVGTGELTLNGALAGALYGAIFGLASTLAARFTGRGGEMGLVAALAIGVGAGAVEGAIVGIVVIFSRSVPAGIATGAVVEALVKLTAMSALGLWWGFTALGIVISLVFGAVFGWVVASSVYNSIKWDEMA